MESKHIHSQINVLNFLLHYEIILIFLIGKGIKRQPRKRSFGTFKPILNHHGMATEEQFTCLYGPASAGRALFPREFWTRKRVTGRFLTSCLHTSHVLLPFMLNHFTAHSWWASASSPLQLHSILRVSAPSPSSIKQILQTASSSRISSPLSSFTSEPQD